MNKERANEIKSVKELEKEFASIPKLFSGKETENNWNERDSSLRRLHAVINSDNVTTWKTTILQGLHDVMPSIIQSIHSLRTNVAMEGLSMIEDTSIAVGEQLDVYTLEIILLNLLKSSSVTKKFIATRTSEVTNQFLAHIAFHSKILILLCKTKNEKNVQLRQSAAEYICTVLSTHASKESVRSHINKSTELINWINQFVKKGITDASPLVRDGCRKTFGVYNQYFPERAKNLYQLLDKPTQNLIDKAPLQKPKTPRLVSRSSSSSSLASCSNSSSPVSSTPTLTSMTNKFSIPAKPITRKASTRNTSPTKTKLTRATSTSPKQTTPTQPTSISSKQTTPTQPTTTHTNAARPAITSITNMAPPNSLKRPTLKREPSTSSSTLKPSPKRRAIIPATSTELKKNISRLSHISTISAPPSNLNHQLNRKGAHQTTTRRTQSEFHQQMKSAAASLLHMLQSNDVEMRRKGVYLLAERLKKQVYRPQPNNEPLPPDVPPKMDLLPVLMANLSQDDKEMYELMTSWESITGIFVHVMPLTYYAPLLILSGGKGLARLKMFLKRNDPDLAHRLLDMTNQLLHAHSIEDVDMLDASVKKAIRLDPHNKTRLHMGLVDWMDELICDHLGIPEEEDTEMLLEGASWLNINVHQVHASQWFDEVEHIRSYVQFALQHLVDQENLPDGLCIILRRMAGHLKMANERIFETEADDNVYSIY